MNSSVTNFHSVVVFAVCGCLLLTVEHKHLQLRSTTMLQILWSITLETHYKAFTVHVGHSSIGLDSVTPS